MECPQNTLNHYDQYALLPYGYSVLDYARKYDTQWMIIVQYLLSIMPKTKKRIRPNYFPAETLYELMSYMDHSTLLKAGKVSKFWYRLSCQDSLWKVLLLHNFGLSMQSLRFKLPEQEEQEHCTVKVQIPNKTMFKKMEYSFRRLAQANHTNARYF
jgi:hypothetical protein